MFEYSKQYVWEVWLEYGRFYTWLLQSISLFTLLSAKHEQAKFAGYLFVTLFFSLICISYKLSYIESE